MHPVALAVDVESRLILMDHLRLRERRFDLPLDPFQLRRALVHQGSNCPWLEGHAQQIREQFTDPRRGDHLILHQLDGQCLDGGSVLDGSIHTSGKGRSCHVMAGGTRLLFDPMFGDEQAFDRQVNDLASLC